MAEPKKLIEPTPEEKVQLDTIIDQKKAINKRLRVIEHEESGLWIDLEDKYDLTGEKAMYNPEEGRIVVHTMESFMELQAKLGLVPPMPAPGVEPGAIPSPINPTELGEDDGETPPAA